MDSFYIPEELIEWISLKKSEYLSKLITHVTSRDIQFEEYHQYEGFISSTLSQPDWATEEEEEGQRIKTFYRFYSEKENFHQIVIGVMVLDQDQSEVFVPILAFVTKDEELVKAFGTGTKIRSILN